MAKKDKAIAAVCVVILLLGVVFFTLTHEEGEGEISSSDAMLEATNNFLAKGKSTMITAEALYANLNDNYAGNDPFILSVRDEMQYEKGHIPGAENIPWRSVFTEENLTKLPTNKQIVVYCYTGHTASQITALLNVLEYDAVCLKWGMCSWTSNTTVAPSCYDKSTACYNYPVSIGTEAGMMGSAVAVGQGIACGEDEPTSTTTLTDTDSDGTDLRAIVEDYLSSGKPPAIAANAFFEKLSDTDTSNDPFILSIRSSSQYAIGHIPGATNIGFSSLFMEENLAKLPDDDTQIVVVCYTGHTASQATALLNINGYNAIALKWGMTSWTNNATVAPSAYDRANDCHNYPVYIGEDPGDLEGAIIADILEVVRGATIDFLDAGKTTMITAEALYNNLNDNYASNDPFILSVRDEEQYEKGHIPGAVNIPWRSVFTEDNISKLPTTKQIVVYCYTGHTASQVTAMLNVLGYDALCLKWGMCSWTTNTTIAPSCFDNTQASDYPVTTGSEPGTRSSTRGPGHGTRQGCGDDNGGGGSTEVSMTGSIFDIVRVASNNYLAEGKSPAVKAEDLYENLNDSDSSNDPFVLSVRKSEQYAVGHITTAINIGLSSLFTDENLSKLPDDSTQIVVVCYTGHTASQATALLNINGYNAIALKWGMTSWTTNTTVAPSRYNKGTDCHNYPVVIGSSEGTLDTAEILGFTDAEILSNAAKAYLEGGTKFIKASDLHDLLNDIDSSNDPFILSIRSSTHYELGHIPGAVNIPWRSLFSVENLSLLPGDETQIVVVCYTGQTASQITALLNTLGHNASTLAHGMCSWTTNTTIAPNCFDNATQQMDYPISDGAEPGSMATAGTRNGGCEGIGGGSGGLYEASSDEWEILRQACERYVNEVSSMTITPKALFNNLDDNYTTNDPFIISIRSSEHYESGHVPGATNIPAGSLFDEGNLETLPTDKQIVVYCYTGQGAGHVSALLSINGYDTISLKFGMCSWTDNSTITANKCYDPTTAGHNYRVSAGTKVGDWETATPAD